MNRSNRNNQNAVKYVQVAAPSTPVQTVPAQPTTLVVYDPKTTNQPSARTLKNRRRRAAARALKNNVSTGFSFSNPSTLVANGSQMVRVGMTNTIPATMKSTAPTRHMAPSTPTGLRVRGREILFKLVNSTADGSFTFAKVALNPLKFNWLSFTAKQYEFYFFHQLRFTWHPAFASANGTMAMCVESDVGDPAYKSVEEVIKNLFSEAGLICSSFGFNYEGRTGAGIGKYYTESNGTTPVLVNQGQLVVVTESVGEQPNFGVKKDSPLGYVFVEYDCEFFCPQQPSA